MKKTDDSNYINSSAEVIRLTLESLGIFTKVAEVNIERKYYQYCLSVAVGTNLAKLKKYGRDLALNIPSPTGIVYWKIPIKGKPYVGLRVPKPSAEELEKFNKKYGYDIGDSNWRNKLASIFFTIGNIANKIANKILIN